MKKNKVVMGVLLLSLALVGFSCTNDQAKNEDNTQNEVTNLPEQDVQVESNMLELDEKDMQADNNMVEDEVAEEEQAAEEENTNLVAVGGYDGTGLATRSFDGKVFKHTVEAEISDPGEGKFYEGWLVTQSPSLSFFSTGKMEKEGDNYVLTYQDDEDKSDFNEVVITEETESQGLDGNPEAHVLEGEF
jgi:hypothetical protein